MEKTRVMVMSSGGKTGFAVARQLLEGGFAVTAFVRRESAKSATLRSLGADIFIGSHTDFKDMTRALSGASRAYFCTPVDDAGMTSAAVFVAAAKRQRLESIVVLSQWLSNPSHPSEHTRAVWLTDELISLLPMTGVTTINVGFFADNDMQALPFAAQLGLMMLPYGRGLNAAPSNEDIGRVVAAILMNPGGHEGRTYRPTGPDLLSPYQIATIVGEVLERKVVYIDAPVPVFSRVMKSMGLSDYFIAQYQQYVRDYKEGAFAAGGPTDVVQSITGRAPESYATIVQRYVNQMPGAQRSLGNALKLMMKTTASMISLAPRTTEHLHLNHFSDGSHAILSTSSVDWKQSHQLRLQADNPGNQLIAVGGSK